MKHMLLSLVAVGFPATLVVACTASTPGAHPHDMGAAQHEAMAVGQDDSARAHAAQYDPDASVTTTECSRGGSPRHNEGYGCWTSVSNATSKHLEQARRARKMAADHRAASQTLRDAEGRACVGLSDEDRDMSPFAHREDIGGVEPLTSGVTSGKLQHERTEGASIVFRAVPGMTVQWLQRVVDCHLARNAALGHEVPEMAFCPLVPKSVTARVVATSSGFAVEVRSGDSDTAAEILRRSQALVGR